MLDGTGQSVTTLWWPSRIGSGIGLGSCRHLAAGKSRLLGDGSISGRLLLVVPPRICGTSWILREGGEVSILFIGCIVACMGSGLVSLISGLLVALPWRSVLLRSSASLSSALAAASAIMLELRLRRSLRAPCKILGRCDFPPAYLSLTWSPPRMYALAILILNGKFDGKKWRLSRNSSLPVKVIIFAPSALQRGGFFILPAFNGLDSAF